MWIVLSGRLTGALLTWGPFPDERTAQDYAERIVIRSEENCNIVFAEAVRLIEPIPDDELPDLDT